ncbi:MAG: aminopeptidase P family protein [Eubacteriaceae bacterium]|nr:aminopeptidase P family protein [Eubacteriaceae bacterium]
MGFIKEKVDVALRAIKEEKIGMWIIAGQESATNSEPILDVMADSEFIGMTAVIFNDDGTSAVICTPIDYNGYAMQNIFTEVMAFPVSFAQTLSEYIARKNPSNIALNYSLDNPAADGLSYGSYLTVKQAIDLAGYKGEVISAQKAACIVRGIKLDYEIERMKKACAVTQEIFDAAKDFIKPGMNCQDVYKFFNDEVERRKVGLSWPASCNPGVFSGYGCPSGHMGAPDWIIKKGDLVNIDFGILVDGYGSDIQRMYYILNDGETDAPEDIKKAFYAVRDGIAMAAKALVPGVTGLEVDTVARQYITSLGYADWNAALGHQLGKYAHDGGPLLGPEKPRYNRDELIRTPLKEGYVFTLEPGVPTRCGRIGIEEDAVVREGGAQFLLEPQQELYLIKA